MQSFHNPCQYSAQQDSWPRSFSYFVAGLSNGSGPAMGIRSSMAPFEAVTFACTGGSIGSPFEKLVVDQTDYLRTFAVKVGGSKGLVLPPDIGLQ
jgi:hypothetical protein